MRCLCGFDNLFIRGVKVAVTDIFHYRTLKQPCILKHHAEIGAELVAAHRINIRAVKINVTGIYVIETHKQVDNRCFARTGGAYNGRDRACRRHNVKIIYKRHIGQISE